MTFRLKKSEVAYRKIGDDFFVLTPHDSTLHNITGVGVRIMELLDEDKDEAAILRVLVEEFDAPAAEVEKDLRAFLSELAAKGIVSENET